MTKLSPVALLFLLLMTLAVGCPGVDGELDAGAEPEAPVCPEGSRCTCETDEEDWPAPLTVELLDLFAESGCTRVRGTINLTPEMLERASDFADVETAIALDVKGIYPAGTNLDELSFLRNLRLVSVLGATGITSLSGLENITNLDIGLHVEDAPDMETIGMSNLRSFGIVEPGSEVVLDEALRLVNLPNFETLGLPEDYTLEAAPLVLMKLPRFDPDEAIALIAQYSAMTDEERDPSPGQSPPTVICELSEAVGNNADRPCPEE